MIRVLRLRFKACGRAFLFVISDIFWLFIQLESGNHLLPFHVGLECRYNAMYVNKK